MKDDKQIHEVVEKNKNTRMRASKMAWGGPQIFDSLIWIPGTHFLCSLYHGKLLPQINKFMV